MVFALMFINPTTPVTGGLRWRAANGNGNSSNPWRPAFSLVQTFSVPGVQAVVVWTGSSRT